MATRTIATKLAIEGEGEYKNSLKNINSELGTLKSELKLVESEFVGSANSYTALSAKGDVLNKMFAEQEKKLSASRDMLEKWQEAQAACNKDVEDAEKEVSRLKEALAALGDETGDTSEEQARLTKELAAAEKAQADANKAYEEATRKCNSYQTQVNTAETELNKLGRALGDNERALDEAAKSSDGCAESVDKYTGKVEKADDETEKFSDKLANGLVAGAKAAGAALVAVGTAAVAGVKLLLDLEESTEEYRIAQGKLNTAFEAAGYSTETASAAYKSLYSVLGDTDTAAESAQLLAQLATSEKDVATWADIAAGVTGTFGDALPVNSLIEASNETAKVGQVTGALADALNWVGISEDEFNEKLAACADETERTALITETLSVQYQNATDIFKKNNETVMQAREAQAELDNALARLGGTVSDVKTELTAEFLPTIADVMDAFADFIKGTEGADDALATAIDELVGKATNKLPEFLDFGAKIVINLVSGIVKAAPSLVEGAVSVITTLTEALLEAVPQLIDAAAQMVAALVKGIGEALPTLIPAAVEAVTQLVQALVENVPLLIDAALQLIQGLAEGVLEAIPVLLEALPELIESLITTLLEAIPQIIETGVTLLTALVENLPDIITTICEVLPQIIESTIATLLEHLPEIVEAGVQLLTSLITNLPQVIAEIVRAMPQIITGMVSALGQGVSQMAEVGANLVRGLWQGIQSLAGWLWDKVSGWISSIWDGITDFFGIASPSKKMAWVSEMNVEGAVVGIEKNKDKAVKAYGAMGEEMLTEVDSGLAAVNDRLKTSIGEIETGFSAKATVEAVSASIPADLTGRGGAPAASGGGDTTVTNHFHIAELVVREEADIKKISRELYNMQKTKSRSKGVSMA